MYINFKILEKYLLKYDLRVESVIRLSAVKSKDLEVIEKYLSPEDCNNLILKGLLKMVKPKNKSQKWSELIRLDKEGEKLLTDITSSLAVSEEIEKLFTWLETLYKKRKSGIIRNKTETKRRLQWFSDITGISGNRLALLLKSFTMDTYVPEIHGRFEDIKEENPRIVFSNMLDNICWCPADRFARHYKLEDSPLFRYYEDNREYVEKIWEQYIEE